MKKYLMILIMMLCGVAYASAETEEDVRHLIERLNDEYPDLKKKDQQRDNRSVVVSYYQKLDTILTASITQKEQQLQECMASYQGLEFLLSEGEDVFVTEYPSNMQVPASLAYHFETIKMIVELRKCLELTETKVKTLSDDYGKLMLNSEKVIDIKSAIATGIENDMYYMDELIRRIKARNLSSLSKKQYQYFKPGLTERYNHFIKFFE